MLYTAVNYQGPAVLRYPRGEISDQYQQKEFEELEIGIGEELIEITDKTKVTIIAVGSTVYPAQKAAEILNNNDYHTALIDARFVKPLDEKLIIKALNNSDSVLIVEEQVLAGGFSSAVLELAADNNILHTQIKRLGIGDEFVPQGEMDEMKREYQLDARGILKNALTLFKAAEEVNSLWPQKKD
jgi:1-deoxy-D-xylulose-5-phosphate synthase